MNAPCLSFRCPLRWEDLDGPGATRHCGTCDRDVHDLSALGPRAAAEILARAVTERVCVRFHPTSTGKIAFAALAASLAGSPALADDPHGYGTWESEVRPGEGAIALPRDTLAAVMGAIDKSAIQDVIDVAKPRIRLAWNQYLKRGGTTEGKVVVRLTVGADGGVTDVTLTRSDIGDEVFEDDITTTLADLDFPTGSGTMVVTYPFVFAVEPAEPSPR